MRKQSKHKSRFVSPTPLILMGECQAIWDDAKLTPQERHQQINRLRRDAIRRYGFFSAEVQTVDRFINENTKASESAQQSRTKAV